MTVRERRRRLLAAAAEVISRDGIASTTTRAITDEAGMPRGTFHYCFESKNQLLGELVKSHVRDMVQAAVNDWDDDRPLTENLTAGLNAFLSVGSSHPQKELISYDLTLYALRSDDPTMATTQYEDYDRQGAVYLEIVADRAGIDWTAPISVLARMFTSMIDGAMLHWLTDRDLAATRASIEAFASALAGLAQPRRRGRRSGTGRRKETGDGSPAGV
ncbi:TetR/AcrR family transcriptional regulator [Amycolatopsis sp. cmx-11-12]|uniref:TetR/AcrR family transcriptional regulator n=1 Tax=Amycolatopsis sp. cmx-11-12 TaxID=2785795 RepID=UPI0039182EA8